MEGDFTLHHFAIEKTQRNNLTSFLHSNHLINLNNKKHLKIRENKNTSSQISISFQLKHIPRDTPFITFKRLPVFPYFALRLTNLSTVAGLGIHCPCFQANERCEMYLVRQVDSWKLWSSDGKFQRLVVCGFLVFFFIWVLCLAWLGTKEGCFFCYVCFFPGVEI